MLEESGNNTNSSIAEEAFACSVMPENWNARLCFSCLKQPGTFQCNACDNAWYCSQGCQQVDWMTKQHLKECELFKNVSTQSQTDFTAMKNAPELRLVFRIWNRYIGEREELNFNEENSSVRDEVIRHPLEPVLNTKQISAQTRNGFRPVLQNFRRLFVPGEVSREDNNLLLDIIVTVYLKFRKILQYRVHDAPVVLGIGLYGGGSRLLHSCSPNLMSFSSGSTLYFNPKPVQRIQTRKTMKKQAICLIDEEDPNLMLTHERTQRLKQRFGFTCLCEACQNPKADEIKMNALKTECEKCREALVPRMTTFEPMPGGNNVPVGLYCHGCRCIQAKIRADEFDVICNVIRKAVDVDPMNPKTVGLDTYQHFAMLAERVIDASSVLHPVKNLLLFRLREAIFVALESMEKIEGSTSASAGYEAGIGMYATMQYYESFSVAKPILCAKLGRMALAIHSTEEAIKWYKRALNHWVELTGQETLVTKQIETIVTELNSTLPTVPKEITTEGFLIDAPIV